MPLPLQRLIVLVLPAILTAGCSSEGAPGTLPEELRYPGAVVARHEPGRDEAFVLETADTEAAVTEFYRRGIPGWRQENATESPQALSLAYRTPDDTRRAWVSIAHGPREGKTTITVTVARR